MTLQDVLGDFGSLKHMVEQVFDDIAIAEEEIQRAKVECPGSSHVLDRAFGVLQRPGVMKSDEVYRRHIRELLKRVVSAGDTRKAMKAEVLACLSDFRLQNVTNKDGKLVMARLIEVVMGDVVGVLDIVKSLREGVGHEDYAGQTDAEIERLQRKVSMSDRVLRA